MGALVVAVEPVLVLDAGSGSGSGSEFAPVPEVEVEQLDYSHVDYSSQCSSHSVLPYPTHQQGDYSSQAFPAPTTYLSLP